MFEILQQTNQPKSVEKTPAPTPLDLDPEPEFDLFGSFETQQSPEELEQKELVQYLTNSFWVRNFHQTHNVWPTREMLERLIQSPEQHGPSAKLSKEEIETLKTWIAETKKELQENKQKFEALSAKHADNPLFKRRFNADDFWDKLSVYHFTSEKLLNVIAEKGLLPAKETVSAETREQADKSKLQRFKIDEIFDKAAPATLSRSNAVYAYHDFRFNQRDEGYGHGDVVLEMKIDPKKAFVADLELVNEAGSLLEQAESLATLGDKEGATELIKDAHKLGEQYWQKAMPLRQLMDMPLETRKSWFKHPEIIIQGSINPNNIRAHSVQA